jgi:hypothetical protein
VREFAQVSAEVHNGRAWPQSIGQEMMAAHADQTALWLRPTVHSHESPLSAAAPTHFPRHKTDTFYSSRRLRDRSRFHRAPMPKVLRAMRARLGAAGPAGAARRTARRAGLRRELAGVVGA